MALPPYSVCLKLSSLCKDPAIKESLAVNISMAFNVMDHPCRSTMCRNVNQSLYHSATRSASKCLFNWLIAILFLGSLPCYAFQSRPYQSVAEIPNPKDAGNGYVSDPQSLLTAGGLDSLNHLLAELDTKTGVEAAVVIIHDFKEDEDDFTFATALFRHWGIGKRGANNGLLLFISTDRRQYRFITGYGAEGLLPDAALAKIGETVLVPAFKEQAYGRGVINAMQVISQYLQQPANKKELNSLITRQTSQPTGVNYRDIWLTIGILASFGAAWQISKFKSPFLNAKQKASNLYADISGWSAFILIGLVCLMGVIGILFGSIKDMLSTIPQALPVIIWIAIFAYFFFAHLSVLSQLRKFYKDDVNYFGAVGKFYRQAWWHALLSPILLVSVIVQVVQIKRLKKRIKPLIDADGKPMQRLDRDSAYDIDKYLSAGQRKEEETGSLVYDIWTTDSSNEVRLVPNNGYHYNDFEACPACGFRTYTKPIEITVERATYAHGGKAKRVKLCRYCNHEQFIEFITLPMLVRSTSSGSGSGSSGSSSSSSGSGSSGSSSGSWGGGSTGGGGAGGRW